MDSYWENKHQDYDRRDWTKKPSIFAEQVIEFFPKRGTLLDLGAGQGQDSVFFAEHGHAVTSTDYEQKIIDRAKNYASKRFAETKQPYEAIDFRLLDMQEPFPFAANSFDVVYAHLSLHYFAYTLTEQIFKEIYRVLKPGGVVAFLANSANDPEYGTGLKLEDGYFETEGTKKRYFSIESAQNFANNFEVILCDDSGETYKDIDKGVHNLIRFIGRKQA